MLDNAVVLTIEDGIKTFGGVGFRWQSRKFGPVFGHKVSPIVGSTVHQNPVVEESLQDQQSVHYILTRTAVLEGSLHVSVDVTTTNFDFLFGVMGKQPLRIRSGARRPSALASPFGSIVVGRVHSKGIIVMVWVISVKDYGQGEFGTVDDLQASAVVVSVGRR